MAVTDKDLFIDAMSSVLGRDVASAVLEELWNSYETGGYKSKLQPGSEDILPDLVIGKVVNGKELTPIFNKQFAQFLKIKNDPNNKTGINTIVEFINARQSYRDTLDFYGVGDLATDENIDKFFENGISLIQAQSRLQAAYDAINFADKTVKEQLGSYNLSGQDLARALILGKDGAAELKDKISTANILAAEVQTGLKSTIGAQELGRMGVTRERAMQGLSQTKEQLPGYQAEAMREGMDAGTIQSDLEKENILGMASQRRKKLQQKAASRFQGQSGTTGISLGKSSAGSI